LGEEIVPDRKNVQSKWEHHRKTGHNWILMRPLEHLQRAPLKIGAL
jgi:hypothetical protein